MSDKEIIAGFLKGSPSTVNLITGWVHSAIDRRLWNGRVSSEDVVADTIEKLLMAFRESSFNIEVSLQAFVRRVALCTLIDAARREKLIHHAPVSPDHPASDRENPHDALEEDEQQALFHRILSLLPRRCRSLWDMVFQEKVKYKELALRLGTSEGSIKSALSQCKKKAIEIQARLT